MTHDRLGRPLIGPCLLWTGKIPKDGYPRMKNRELGTSPQLVHRVSYAIAQGIPFAEIKTIPLLDHLCRVPACSAALHVEPVTCAENLRRGDGNQNVGKTVCVNGHEFTPENTYWRRNGGRDCIKCKRRAARESWRRLNRPDLVGVPPKIGGHYSHLL